MLVILLSFLNSVLDGLSREAWWSALNTLSDLLNCLLGSKMLQPPGGTCLGK